MDTDKAYLLGLIIGGGVFGNAEDIFRIQLPFRKWGALQFNPKRAGNIANDILRKVGQMFRAVYNINIQYDASDAYWTILCEGDTTQIIEDLQHYGIECMGELKTTASLERIVLDLVDDNLKRRFIAGLADTIGSMAQSHRRFSNEHQILSFEIKGYNFRFVCDLCRLLYSINCVPDQVNWNHPNIHCTNDSYYTKWHKGFKLRVLLDQYAKFGAFAFRTKVESSHENRKLQKQTHEAEQCEAREFHVTPTCVHPSEHDLKLPDNIRGGHYIHFRHFCAVMGCEHAPYEQLKNCFCRLGEIVNPFPILHKGSIEETQKIINSDSLLSNRTYKTELLKVSIFLNEYERAKTTLLYGNGHSSGYPIAIILQGIAYIVARSNEVKGKRVKGNYVDLIKKHLEINPELTIEVRIPDLLTPLILVKNQKAALIGAQNPSVYQKLIMQSSDNEYKLLVRQISEKDLRS